MALPKISTPIFTVELPSTGKKVKYRPFTVKEEKILLMARESEDVDQMILATKQILNNCLIDLDVETLPTFDIEWLLLHIRAASVDNDTTFPIKDPDTQEVVEISFNIDDVKVHTNPDHVKEIRADNEYIIIMRYPTIEETFMMFRTATKQSQLQKKLREETDETKKTEIHNELKALMSEQVEFKIMMNCLETLVSEDEVFKFAESTEEEKLAFVDSLSPKAIKSIQKFFETMPAIRHEIKYKNSEGADKTFVIQGFDHFFM